MFHLCDTITLRAYFDSCHSIYVTEGFLYIFIKQTGTSEEGFHVSCRNHLHLQNHGWTPIEIALVFHVSPAPFSSRASYLRFVLFYPLPSPPFFLSMLDASIEILLACSFEWFEVLKRRSITRHSRNPEEDDAVVEKDEDENDESDESTGKTFRAGNCRSNSWTRIVRRVLMDYLSRRKPVDQRKFIVTAFAIDVYSYLDKRLDIDVISAHAWPIQ